MTDDGVELLDKELTGAVIGDFQTVYNTLGYGFAEAVYSNALSLELRLRGLKLERERPVEVFYRGQPMGRYRTDMIVEGRLLVEIKASIAIVEADRAQVFNYLRATDLPLALLLHFGPNKPQAKRFISPKALCLSGA
jgi:GxxExxY protein